MSIQLPDEPARPETVAVDVDCTVAVSRDGRGDLVDGVRARLASTDGVRAVEELELAGIRPGLNDLTVEVRARLRVDPDVDAASRLAATFGIRDVSLRARKGPPG